MRTFLVVSYISIFALRETKNSLSLSSSVMSAFVSLRSQGKKFSAAC